MSKCLEDFDPMLPKYKNTAESQTHRTLGQNIWERFMCAPNNIASQFWKEVAISGSRSAMGPLPTIPKEELQTSN